MGTKPGIWETEGITPEGRARMIHSHFADASDAMEEAITAAIRAALRDAGGKGMATDRQRELAGEVEAAAYVTEGEWRGRLAAVAEELRQDADRRDAAETAGILAALDRRAAEAKRNG